jgi:hypothetical protein
VKPAEVRELLGAVFRDKFALQQRHIAASSRVRDYDFNNAYQYVINREDMHIAWLREALAAAGGSIPEPPPPPAVSGDSQDAIFAEDRDRAAAFVARWKGPIAGVTNARHRTMLQLLLGETLEHQRFFAQAAAGLTDLLGRRDGPVRRGHVLPTRWVE